MWSWNRFRECQPPQTIVAVQSERAVDPFPTPPFPAHTLALSGPHQMPPDLLLYPAFDHGEAATRMTDPKVVHPASQDRIDLLDHLPHRLTDVSSEDLLEFGKQRGPLLQLRRQLR